MSTPVIPLLPGDPKNGKELARWLAERERAHPGAALSPREYLIVTRVKDTRPKYSLT